MAKGSLSEQFLLDISKEIGRRTKKRCMAIMQEAAFRLMGEVPDLKRFHDVTGNLLNSIAVGIYYKGKLEMVVDSVTMGWEPPVRRSLAKGEEYDHAYYYSGMPSRHMTKSGTLSRAFVGVVGSGGQDGESAARRSLRQRHPKSDYAMIVVSPMQYAKYVERLKGHDVLSSIREEMPNVFESSIVTIKP